MMAMDMLTGVRRPLLGDDEEEAQPFAELIKKLMPTEVGVFGPEHHIQRLQRLIDSDNERKASPDE